MRLIDADEAIREYEACIENYILSGNDSKSRYIEDWEYVIKQLSGKPTAYDVEAVVRELEDKVEFYESREKRQMELDCGMAACHTNGVQQGIKFAIEIVRGGRNE
jgi:tetrahydromethanopterin S-methyltransferase subunit F